MSHEIPMSRSQATSVRPVNCTFGEDVTPIKGFETNSQARPDVVAFLSVPQEDLVHIHVHSIDGEAEIQISSAQMLDLMAQFTTLLTASESKQ